MVRTAGSHRWDEAQVQTMHTVSTKKSDLWGPRLTAVPHEPPKFLLFHYFNTTTSEGQVKIGVRPTPAEVDSYRFPFRESIFSQIRPALNQTYSYLHVRPHKRNRKVVDIEGAFYVGLQHSVTLKMIFCGTSCRSIRD